MRSCRFRMCRQPGYAETCPLIDGDVFSGIDILYDIHVVSNVCGRLLFRRKAVGDFIRHDPLQAFLVAEGEKGCFRKQYPGGDQGKLRGKSCKHKHHTHTCTQR